MRFLSTLFWAIVAAVVVLFFWVNSNPVTLNIWSNLQVDIKLPILLLIVFLLGFLPTWVVHRARLWSHRRRIEALERQNVASPAEEIPIHEEEPAA